MLKEVGRYTVRYTLILFILVLLTGCGGEDSRAIVDLVSLQMQLLVEYGASGMVVELQDQQTLGVTVVADASRGPAREQRAQYAQEIAEFLCDNYPSIDRIEQVQVSFETGRNGLLVDTASLVTFAFPRSELACWSR